MKKYISLLLAVIAVLSLAACSKDTGKGEKKLAPKVKDITVSEDYKSSAGKTSFRLDITLPEITGECSDLTKTSVNSYIESTIEDLKKFAQSNADNAQTFMDEQKTNTPWTRTIRYETKYMSDTLACFLVLDGTSIGGEEPEYSRSTLCFELVTGAKYTALDFGTQSEVHMREDALRLIENSLRINYGVGINSLHREDFEKSFNWNNFYVEEDSITFYIPKSVTDPGERGYYFCPLKFDDVKDYFIRPSDIVPKNYFEKTTAA